MDIATWNINGIKARAPLVSAWLARSSPDIACLQEIKSLDEKFPHEHFADSGYNIETHGQKSFNGVAIFSKYPFDAVHIGLPGDEEDAQARYLEAVLCVDKQTVRVGCLYLPNGNPVDSEKFPYKLAWMERLIRHIQDRLTLEEKFILLGDFNIIPEPRDARYPEKWQGDALFHPQSLARYRQLVNLGLVDAIRAVSDDSKLYSFWDFQAGAFRRNDGIRIDHMLLSPQAADRLSGAWIEADMRAEPRPSDHVPVWCRID